MICGSGMCVFVLAAGIVVGASVCAVACGVKGEANRKPGSAGVTAIKPQEHNA